MLYLISSKYLDNPFGYPIVFSCVVKRFEKKT